MDDSDAKGRSRLHGGVWLAGRDLESLYNVDGQQRGGALLGLLRLVPRAARDHPVTAALLRGPFNVNPILAGYVMAPLALRLARPVAPAVPPEVSPTNAAGSGPAEPLPEVDAAGDAVAVERARELLTPVLSGLGDRLFWGGVRPGLSLMAILGWVLWIGNPAAWYWVGYNAVQWHWRRRAWHVGLQGEEAVRRELSGPRLRRWIAITTGSGRFLLGGAIGVIVTWLWMRERLSPRGAPWGALPLLFLGCIGIGFLLARRGRPGPLALGWIALFAAGATAVVRQALGGLGH